MTASLSTVVDCSRAVTATRSRREKVRLLARCIAAVHASEAGLAVDYLSGRLPQGRIGLGPRQLAEMAGVAVAPAAGLTLTAVDVAISAIASTAGSGSAARRRELLAQLWQRATAPEQEFLARLLLAELRQGALEGVMADAIAQASGIDAAEVRRAAMTSGSLARVAEQALGEGDLSSFRLRLMHPLLPMLADSSESVEDAIARIGEAAVEYKLDGARVQVHRDGNEVRVFSRRLNDVTGSLPELVEAALALPARRLILDGEVIALGDGGRPLPFQVTMSRFGSRRDVDRLRREIPLSVAFFDCLHADGADLIGEPGGHRFEALASTVPEPMRIRRLVTADAGRAAAFLEQALNDGHEGVMVKSLDAVYEAGRRGSGWRKVKSAHSLDLVVLAAEWGSGRRRGWLSNLHLGARRADGTFAMLGKTFKGLTDETLKWQTGRLLELEVGRDRHTVYVRPELVVEIAFNGVQSSPHYEEGMALRFARVKGYRPDKQAAEADTVDAVRRILERQSAA